MSSEPEETSNNPYLPPPLDGTFPPANNPRALNFSQYFDETSPNVNAATQALTVHYAEESPASSGTETFSFGTTRAKLAPLPQDEQSRQAVLRERLQANAGKLKLQEILNRQAAKPLPPSGPPPEAQENLNAVVKKLKLHEADPNSYDAQHARLVRQARVTQRRPEDLDPNYQTPAEREAQRKKLAKMKRPEDEEQEYEDAMPVDPMAERTLAELGIDRGGDNEEFLKGAEIIEEKQDDYNKAKAPSTNLPGARESPLHPAPLSFTVAPPVAGAPPMLAKGEALFTRREDFMDYRQPLNRAAQPAVAETFVESKESGKFLRLNVQQAREENFSMRFSAANPTQRNAILQENAINPKTAALIRKGQIRVNIQTGQLEFTGKGKSNASENPAGSDSIQSLAEGVYASQTILNGFYLISSSFFVGFSLLHLLMIFTVRWSPALVIVTFSPFLHGMGQISFILSHFCMISSIWFFYLESIECVDHSILYYHRFISPYNHQRKINGKITFLRNFTLCLFYFICIICCYITIPIEEKMIGNMWENHDYSLGNWENSSIIRGISSFLAFFLLVWRFLQEHHDFLHYEQLRNYFLEPEDYQAIEKIESRKSSWNAKGVKSQSSGKKILTKGKKQEIQQSLIEQFTNVGIPKENQLETEEIPLPQAISAGPGAVMEMEKFQQEGGK